MTVVSADGRRWSPTAIFPGVMQKFRIWLDGRQEYQYEYFPPNFEVAYRTPQGLESKIVLQWVDTLVKETKALSEQLKYVLLSLDGFDVHFFCTSHFTD